MLRTRNVGLRKIKTNMLEFKLELELGLGLKLEWLEGVSKTLGRLVYFVPYLYGGRSPPYNYNTKYTSLPRVFDTPSSHSNFNPNPNSNSNLNSNIFVLIFRRPTFLVRSIWIRLELPGPRGPGSSSRIQMLRFGAVFDRFGGTHEYPRSLDLNYRFWFTAV